MSKKPKDVEIYDESLPYILGTGACHTLHTIRDDRVKEKPQIGFIRPKKNAKTTKRTTGNKRRRGDGPR